MTEERNHDLAMRMAELARAAAAPRSVEDVLSDVTAAALGADSRCGHRRGAVDRQGRQVGLVGRHLRPAPSAGRAADEVQRGAVRGGRARRGDRPHRRLPHRAAVAQVLACGRRDRRAQRGVLQAVHGQPHRRGAQLVRVQAQRVRRRVRDVRHGPGRPRRGGDPGQPRGRGASVGAVHPRPHRPGQGHHHGALQRRRHARLRDAAQAVPGQQHPAVRHRRARHRHARRRHG